MGLPVIRGGFAEAGHVGRVMHRQKLGVVHGGDTRITRGRRRQSSRNDNMKRH